MNIYLPISLSISHLPTLHQVATSCRIVGAIVLLTSSTFSPSTRVRYILNVTREIDNFFPGTFSYHNVRVYDSDATDLLAHWSDTYNFIVQAKWVHSG